MSDAATVSVLMQTSLGDMTIELDAAKAPKTVANFLAYVDAGHYDGLAFHRVIKDFMIQGGGYSAPDYAEKKNGKPIENEWIRRTTGMVLNSETGEYDIDPSAGVLNEDGSVKIDTTDAASANEKAYGDALQNINPNRLEAATAINRQGAQVAEG